MAPRAIITGRAGLIGQYFVRNASRWASGWEVHGLSRADLDLTDAAAVDRTWRSIRPDAVIHCAAMSRTKECEQNPELARRINVEATTHLAKLSKDIPFIFLSSGEVFDGTGSWYKESDRADPINIYGKNKLEAERYVLQNPGHTAVRIVLTAGTSRQNNRSFVEDMCRAGENGGNVTLYDDEFRCPLPAGVISRGIWELLDRNQPGLYHLGGCERLSRWEIGQALLPWYPELRGRLIKGSSRDHHGAPRPADLSLNCDKLQRLLSFQIPGFRSWLDGHTRGGADLWDFEPGVS